MMRLRRIALTASLMAILSVPALAQVKLERKIVEGSTRTTEQVTRVEQKLTIAGMETETESDSRVTVKSTTGKRDDSGNIRVQEKIVGMMITTKVQGTEYVFDSANPDKASGSALEMLRPVHKALSGRTTTTVWDKDNKITQIEFDQDALNGLEDNVRKLVKDEMDPEKIKKAANEELDRIPADAVKKGDAWERTSKRSLGAGQMLTATTRYTYEGEIEKDGKKLDKITSKVLSVDLTLEDSPLPLTIKSTDLKPTESKGELLFDRKVGQMISGSSSVRIVGDITFVINNMELPSKLDLKMETASQPKE
jgi:hypothetical protein